MTGSITHVLFDFTPSFCPDCGQSWESLYRDKYTWIDYRTGIRHCCSFCGLEFYFVRDLQTIIQRLSDAETIHPSAAAVVDGQLTKEECHVPEEE